MPFVMDNSVVMAWCFENESSPHADKVLALLEKDQALVPGIWPLEVVNVLLVAERKRRLSKADATRFLDLLHSLPIHVEVETDVRVMDKILALGRESGLSSYDASYLDLAIRRGLPLATLDMKLQKAARDFRVPLVTAP